MNSFYGLHAITLVQVVIKSHACDPPARKHIYQERLLQAWRFRIGHIYKYGMCRYPGGGGL